MIVIRSREGHHAHPKCGKPVTEEIQAGAGFSIGGGGDTQQPTGVLPGRGGIWLA